MIEAGSGNLLTADVEALVNTVNTVGVMGKGVALQFKRAFPANFTAYRAACGRGEVRLGEMFVFDTGTMRAGRYIINFPTKQHWRNPSRLEDIEAGLFDLVRVVLDRGISSIAIPALGCGNGGLDWSQVRPLIMSACTRMPDVRSVIFPPSLAPAAKSMPNATPRPNLTVLRALLLITVARYLDRARLLQSRDGVSELEIQKLTYFLQVLGAPLGLAFVRVRYGPYADRLVHVLDTLEGHYLTGLGDRSTRVTELAPINLTRGSLDGARRILAADPSGAARVEALLSLVGGFETPYSMELLATVHFAAHREPLTAEPGELSDRVKAWNLRKARLFTDHHVATAAERLSAHGLLPA